MATPIKGSTFIKRQAALPIDSPIVPRRVRIESSKTRGKSGGFRRVFGLVSVKNKPFPFRTISQHRLIPAWISQLLPRRLFSNNYFASPSVAWKRQSNLFRGKKFSPVKRSRGEGKRGTTSRYIFSSPSWKVHIRENRAKHNPMNRSNKLRVNCIQLVCQCKTSW